MDNVTVYTETAYNLSNLTRNLNKNRKKSIAVKIPSHLTKYRPLTQQPEVKLQYASQFNT